MVRHNEVIRDDYRSGGPIDFLVVGAGLSGLQVAKDLSKLGMKNVWVLEAGPNLGLEHTYWEHDVKHAQELWQLLRNDPSFHRAWISQSEPHYSGASGLRRRLGGRSLYWHGAVIRLEPWALNPVDWPAAIVRDLSEGVDGNPSFYEAQESEVEIQVPTPGTQLAVSILQAAGYERAKAVPLAVRYSQSLSYHSRWAAYSPLDYWRQTLEQGAHDEVESLPKIACNTEVLSLLHNGGKVSGAKARNRMTGEVTNIPCRHIVLAAGTIENTHLVLDALIAEGTIERPEIHGLMDHLVVGCLFRVRLSSVPHEWNSVEIPSFGYIPGNADTRFNLFVSITRSDLDNHALLIDIWAMGEQLRGYGNTVSIDPGSTVKRSIFVSAGLSKLDHKLIELEQEAVIELSKHLLHELGVSSFLVDTKLPSSSPVVGDFAQALRNTLGSTATISNPSVYISPLGTVDHEGGTLPFGSFLNDYGELYYLRGLYAVGPCTFPRMGAANPSLTTLALAKRTAFHLSL